MRTAGGPDWRSDIERLIPGAAEQATIDAEGTFKGDLDALRSWDFNDVDLSRIPRPVLYLVGERSAANVQSVTDMFVAAVPDTEVVAISDADHNMQMIWPDRFAQAIAAFLDHRTR